MKILYVTDIHGSRKLLKKILGFQEMSDVLVVGGDICPNHLVPIIDYGDFIGMVKGKDIIKLKNMEEALDYKEILYENGYIPWFGTKEEFEKLDKEKYYINAQEEFLNFFIKSIKKKFKKIFMILGNDDRKVIKKILENAEGILHINEKIFENEGYEFVGFSFVPITPFKTSFELKEEDIHIKIENLVKKLKNPSKSIWVFHAPPKDTGLDICLKLDENLRPVYEDNEPVFHSVGSISVRNAIEKYQPFLYLCGHIHESPGIRKIGKTLCINPGSEHEKGILRLAFIDTEKREVEIWSL